MEHPILKELAPHQPHLVDIIGEVWTRLQSWPIYDYVERTFRADTGGDAVVTLYQLPEARRPNGPDTYRLVYGIEGQGWGDPGHHVGLTVAGMYHCPSLRDQARQLVLAVSHVAGLDASLEPNPSRVVGLDLTLDQLRSHLGPFLGARSNESLAGALQQEPPFWGVVGPGGDNALRFRGSNRGLQLFTRVTEPEGYLRRMVSYLGADVDRSPVPVLSSALSLAEALGYLDAVWRAWNGSHLLGIVRPASAAKLATACNSSDEFDGRLSALADVLAGLQVVLTEVAEKKATEANEKSLTRLRRRLEAELEPEAFARASVAIDDLRAAGQHAGAMTGLSATLGRLGVRIPEGCKRTIRALPTGCADLPRRQQGLIRGLAPFTEPEQVE